MNVDETETEKSAADNDDSINTVLTSNGNQQTIADATASDEASDDGNGDFSKKCLGKSVLNGVDFGDGIIIYSYPYPTDLK